MSNFKHVRIKKDKLPNILEHMVVFRGKDVANISDEYLKRAFGVQKTDKCPATGRTRVHLLDSSNMEIFAWVFEDFVEDIRG
jgi:hypothetical protein